MTPKHVSRSNNFLTNNYCRTNYSQKLKSWNYFQTAFIVEQFSKSLTETSYLHYDQSVTSTVNNLFYWNKNKFSFRWMKTIDKQNFVKNIGTQQLLWFFKETFTYTKDLANYFLENIVNCSLYTSDNINYDHSKRPSLLLPFKDVTCVCYF